MAFWPGGLGGTRLYDVLGLPRSASQEEIRRAYRQLALQHHPDRGGDPERFKVLAEAYEILGDPASRQRYDLLGDAGLRGSWGPGAGTGAAADPGGATWGVGVQRRTEDVVHHIQVTLEELYNGSTRRMAITRDVLDVDAPLRLCLGCGGRGALGGLACGACRGTGASPATRRERIVLEVPVEQGAPDGHRVIFEGKADERPGWSPGDVVFVLQEQQHKEFHRKADDLYVERTITLLEALIGFTIKIRHLDSRMLHARSPGVLQPRGMLRPGDADWTRFEDTEVPGVQDVAEVQSDDIEACQQMCRQRGFSGFVQSEGGSRVQFSALSRAELLARRRPRQGAILHVAPDEARQARFQAEKAVRGEGMPCRGNPLVHGNLFVLLHIAFPTTLSDEAIQLLREVLPPGPGHGRLSFPLGEEGDMGLEEQMLRDLSDEELRPNTGDEPEGEQYVPCRQQ